MIINPTKAVVSDLKTLNEKITAIARQHGLIGKGAHLSIAIFETHARPRIVFERECRKRRGHGQTSLLTTKTVFDFAL